LESFVIGKLIVEPSFIVALIAFTKPSYIKKITDFDLDQLSNLSLPLYQSLLMISQQRH
jgi:hypothetical protein